MVSEEIFVYDGIEVRKTGRIAVKQTTSKLSKRQPIRHELLEIEPVDKYQEWKKWIREVDLYKVEQSHDI